MEENKESVKNDFKDKKVRFDLVPLEELEDIAKVYTAGAEKYGENCWQNLPNGYNRYKGALFRHILAYEKGEDFDSETQCRHLAAAAWNCIAMLYCSKHNKNESKSKAKDTEASVCV